MVDVTVHWRDGATPEEIAEVAGIDRVRAELSGLSKRRLLITNRARMRAVYRAAKKSAPDGDLSVDK